MEFSNRSSVENHFNFSIETLFNSSANFLFSSSVEDFLMIVGREFYMSSVEILFISLLGTPFRTLMEAPYVRLWILLGQLFGVDSFKPRFWRLPSAPLRRPLLFAWRIVQLVSGDFFSSSVETFRSSVKTFSGDR